MSISIKAEEAHNNDPLYGVIFLEISSDKIVHLLNINININNLGDDVSIIKSTGKSI